MNARCKACGAHLEWVRSPLGKMIPVNDEPYRVLVTDDGAAVRGRRSHWETCPKADEFRKKKGANE